MSEKEQGVVARDQRVQEALCYLQGRRGFFSIVVPSAEPGRRQRPYVVQELREVLEGLEEEGDVWISQALLRVPRRSLVNVLSVGLLFVDLDTYKDERLAALGLDALLEEVTGCCEERDVPQPSLVIFSGRGLQLKWLLTEQLPAYALPRWSWCQRVLCERLAPLRADPAACDAARVLRVVGTVNSRSGCEARVVSGDVRAPVRYSFEDLCEALRPYRREEVRVFKAATAERRAARQAAQPSARRRPARRVVAPPRRDKRWANDLAWARFCDLRTVIELRGGIDPGARMLFLFWCLNFVCLSRVVDSEEVMRASAEELVRSIDPSWCYEPAELSTLLARSIAYANGEVVAFRGEEYPPLYTPKNEYLIRVLGITLEEQRSLGTIISREVARERNRARDEKHRREKREAQPRAAYLEGVSKAERNAKIVEMYKEGRTQQQIAEAFGLRRQVVGRIINKNK